MIDYKEFLKQKQRKVIYSGFDVTDDQLNNQMFPFQKFIIKRALAAGKYAIFADTGMGKTLMQLVWADHVSKHTKNPVIIFAPLAVSEQTIEEGAKFGINVSRYPAECDIQITNYEQIDNVDISLFSGIVLDESSILKNETGVYRNSLIGRCKETPYKLACTATPSPNDPMELGNHAEFLDVMNYNEMLAMYFINDAATTKQWRLKGHAIDKFYEFISSWAIMINLPSDIGFSNDGYDLPALKMNEIQVSTKVPDGLLFGGLAVSATDFNKSLRETQDERLDEVVRVVQSEIGSDQVIIWTKQNQEADEIYRRLVALGYDCRNVQGSDSPETKRDNLLAFAHGQYQVLITKAKIASFGMNFQSCHNQIFASVDFSFESTYQAIRRS